MYKKIIFVLLCLTLILSACSGTSNVVGKWIGSDGIIIEFFSDGTVSISGLGLSFTGKYELIDKDSIKMELDGLWGLAGATIYDFQISGNKMTMTGDGATFVLERNN